MHCDSEPTTLVEGMGGNMLETEAGEVGSATCVGFSEVDRAPDARHLLQAMLEIERPVLAQGYAQNTVGRRLAGGSLDEELRAACRPPTLSRSLWSSKQLASRWCWALHNLRGPKQMRGSSIRARTSVCRCCRMASAAYADAGRLASSADRLGRSPRLDEICFHRPIFFAHAASGFGHQ